MTPRKSCLLYVCTIATFLIPWSPLRAIRSIPLSSGKSLQRCQDALAGQPSLETLKQLAKEIRRDPDQPLTEINNTYLRNYYHSKTLFKRALKSGELKTHFEEVTRNQHRVLALGTDGKQAYNGHHPSRNLKDILPGVFVFDEVYLDSLINSGGLASPATQITFFETTTMSILNPQTTKLLLVELEELKGLKDFYTLEVDGIPSTDLPTNSVEGDYANKLPTELTPFNFVHEYPKLPFNDPMSGRRVYFERAKQLMLQLLDEPSVDTKIDLLATYYHVAINGHFFVAGNNSVLMAQVNVILENLGYQPLNHGVLDYLSLLLSTKRFNKVFRSRLVPTAGGVR